MSPRRSTAPRTLAAGLALSLAAASAALAAGAILLTRAGTGDRLALTVPILIAAVAAGIAPLEYGLPAALVLSSFAGLLKYFAGGEALYWNEIFVALIVGRSLVHRRPSRRELGVAALIALLFAGYAFADVSAESIGWGAKVLLTSAVLLWALARLDLGTRLWRATYIGLVLAITPNVALAGWQRSQGADELRALGLPEQAVPRTVSGALRAFGGFTSHAAFAYTCVLALVVWVAFAARGTEAERRLAFATAWLPLAGVCGLWWSRDRTAVAAGASAFLALAVLVPRSARLRLAAAAGGVGLAGAIAAVAVLAGDSFVGEAFSPRSDIAKMRIAQARAYLQATTLFGAGPGSAGSAYERVAGAFRGPPLDLTGDWGRGIANDYSRVLFLSSADAIRPHPEAVSARTLTLVADARSIGETRRLVARALDTRKRLGSWRLEPGRWARIEVAIPLTKRAPGAAFLVSPDAEPFAVELRSPRLQGLRGLRPAERVTAHEVFQGEPPGVVDNLYVSWIFQYGIVATLPIVVWLLGAWWLLVARVQPRSLEAAARGVGAFVAVGALTVNLWEEFPTDFVVVVIAAQVAAAAVRERRVARS